MNQYPQSEIEIWIIDQRSVLRILEYIKQG